MFFLVVVNIVYAFFETFGIVHAVTGGGPARATEILVFKVFRDGFVGLDLGRSAAQSVILMAIVIGLTSCSSATSSVRSTTDGRAPVRSHAPDARGPAGRHCRRRLPIYVTFVASTHTLHDVVRAPMPLLPGHLLVANYRAVLTDGLRSAGGAPVGRMLVNSLVMALVIAAGKIAISLLSAFAIVYFRFPFRAAAFWTIFLTLMLPVEVRIVPTYKVIADLGMLNSYAGLTVPLIASATATFLFRQFFLTVPTSCSRPRASTAPARCGSSRRSWCRCRARASPRCS